VVHFSFVAPTILYQLFASKDHMGLPSSGMGQDLLVHGLQYELVLIQQKQILSMLIIF
jgi:hypothetical protein